MEQLPLTANGIGLGGADASIGANQPVNAPGNGQNTGSFADIANRLIGEQLQSQQKALGLNVALAKLKGGTPVPGGKAVGPILPVDGNTGIPYGNDALTLSSVTTAIQSQTQAQIQGDVSLANLPVNQQAQSRLQQLVQSNKLNATSLAGITNKEGAATDAAALDLKAELPAPKPALDPNALPSKQSDLAQLIQDQKQLLKSEPMNDLLTEVGKRAGREHGPSALIHDLGQGPKVNASEGAVPFTSYGLTDKADANLNQATNLPRIQQPLNHPQWGNEFANRVVVIAKQHVHEAQIKINPPNLGPIELRVSVQNDQANISFISNHAQVRDAIEAALPRLKEMFEQSGFGSLDVDIKNQQQAKQSEQDKSTTNFNGDADYESDEEALDLPSVNASSRAGSQVSLVDYFV